MARANKTRFAVLGILSLGSASGYDIKKMMAQSTDHFWREGDGSIYPILKQLLDEGLLTCEIENSDSEKPKKVYSLTVDGQQELEDWLVEDPSLFPNRNELLLKVFFGWNVDPKITIHHIENFKRTVQSIKDKYETIAQQMFPQPLSGAKLFQFLTLKAGMINSAASLEWCDEALRMLKK